MLSMLPYLLGSFAWRLLEAEIAVFKYPCFLQYVTRYTTGTRGSLHGFSMQTAECLLYLTKI